MHLRGKPGSNSPGSRRPNALRCTPLLCALPGCTLNRHTRLGMLLERSEKDTAMIHSLGRSSRLHGPAFWPQARFSHPPHLAQLFCNGVRVLGRATGLPTALSGHCYATSQESIACGFKVFRAGRVPGPKA